MHKDKMVYANGEEFVLLKDYEVLEDRVEKLKCELDKTYNQLMEVEKEAQEKIAELESELEVKDNLLKISKDYADFTNTTSGMQEAAKDDANFSSEFLGGQNPFKYFAPVAENIQIAPLSAYDQGCVELIQNSFSDYFQGKVDYEKAKVNFETAIKERYPDITEIKWAE